jgi:hypothetical protein
MKRLLMMLMLLSGQGYVDGGQSKNFFLIGSDEDGCDVNYLVYCACIEIKNASIYCGYIDGQPVHCRPASDRVECDENDIIYAGKAPQNDCISEVFQSIISPLPVVNERFCQKNKVMQCAETGLDCQTMGFYA